MYQGDRIKKRNLLKGFILTGGIAFSILSAVFVVSDIFIPKTNREILTFDKLASVTKKYGCVLVEATVDNPHIDYNYEVKEGSCPYVIDYTVYNDNLIRDNMFKSFKQIVESNYNIESTTSYDFGGENPYKELTTIGDLYNSVVLYKDSILLIFARMENVDDAKKIKKELGYYYEPNWEMAKYLVIPVGAFLGSILGVSKMNENDYKRHNSGYIGY